MTRFGKHLIDFFMINFIEISIGDLYEEEFEELVNEVYKHNLHSLIPPRRLGDWGETGHREPRRIYFRNSKDAMFFIMKFGGKVTDRKF